jgi:K+-transporting ATPase ATPase A chain
MFLMQLGEILPGGVGSGLYGIIVFALIRLHRRPHGGPHAGTISARRSKPRDEAGHARRARPAAGHPRLHRHLRDAALALASLGNSGPHGLSEILYAYTSAAGNNGSAFRRPDGQHALVQHHARHRHAARPLRLCHPGDGDRRARWRPRSVPPSAGTFPTHGPLFVGLLIGIILILGGLQFFPALALGPIVEHFAMLAGQTF